jgi:hypothetical protein
MTLLNLHPAIKMALTQHVNAAMLRLDPIRYRQEPNYMAALLGKLDAVVYDGPHGYLEIRSTSVDGIGAGAAEKWCGADFALIAVIRSGGRQVTKSVLGQAKRGALGALSPAEGRRFGGQRDAMAVFTDHYVVVSTPAGPGETISVIRSTPSNPAALHPAQTLPDYLETFVQCSHGDRGKKFTEAVQNSRLPKLKIIADATRREPS